MIKTIDFYFVRFGEDGHCEILERMDKISKSNYKRRKCHYYILNIGNALSDKSDFVNEKNGNRQLLIRRVGRSCGFIEIDKEDAIVDFNFYEEIGQDEEMKKIIKEYLGYHVNLLN